MVQASSSIPATMGKMEKLAGLNKQSFTEYVVCPKCSCIFEYKDCIQIVNGKKESKRCCHAFWVPNHPQPCGTLLLKSHKTKKRTVLTPIKVYPYRSLKTSLCHLLKRPSFVEKCEQWRSRANVIPEDFLGDVYDGNIWKRFSSAEYNNFLNNPHSYRLTLNIDCHSNELCTPLVPCTWQSRICLEMRDIRNERYKQENVILVLE